MSPSTGTILFLYTTQSSRLVAAHSTNDVESEPTVQIVPPEELHSQVVSEAQRSPS